MTVYKIMPKMISFYRAHSNIKNLCRAFLCCFIVGPLLLVIPDVLLLPLDYCIIISRHELSVDRSYIDPLIQSCGDSNLFHVNTMPYVGGMFTFSVMLAGDVGPWVCPIDKSKRIKPVRRYSSLHVPIKRTPYFGMTRTFYTVRKGFKI